MKWKDKLSTKAFNKFCFSRGYIRHSLSNLLHIDPLDVPIDAKPGKAPILKLKNKFISISHSKEDMLFACASNQIGIDIEREDRYFEALKISKKFYSNFENIELSKINSKNFNREVLKYWVIKEAAFKWERFNKNSNIFQWEWRKKSNIAINPKRNLSVKTFLFKFEKYFCAIAYNS
tara:strand:- start:90 stop:620 length:531 start_codon:yes stop_codon:yes gene_type:complete